MSELRQNRPPCVPLYQGEMKRGGSAFSHIKYKSKVAERAFPLPKGEIQKGFAFPFTKGKSKGAPFSPSQGGIKKGSHAN